jgi:hypothetical protein
VLNSSLKVVFIAFVACVFFACGNKSDSVPVIETCPEGFVCDTTYVNAKAYSFVYYSGKNRLDTITETTDKISCDIWNGYFECTLKKSYSCAKAMVTKMSVPKMSVQFSNDKKRAKHKTIKIKVGDTTYINYGKHRLTNFIPPYHEIPPFNAEKMKEAFDTVIVEKPVYSDTKLTGDSRKFRDYYRIEESELPSWVHISRTSGKMVVFDGKDGTPSVDTTIMSSDGCGQALMSGCFSVSYVKYPKDLVMYRSKIHVYGDTAEIPQKDTTIKWMAHYTDMYGVEDSLQIETLFRINRKK